MIWAAGRVIPDDALRVSVLDRTFEHGLGLFETFRTWNGHPTLLNRHLERLQRSARELNLPLDPSQLPDSRAVLELRQASSVPPGQDIRLRITLSGGLVTAIGARDRDPGRSSVLWMTAGPLPPPLPRPGAVVTRSLRVSPDDPLAKHKTLNYWRRRIAYSQALEEGSDDVLCLTPDGLICEATRFNVFLVDGQRLLTPGVSGPLLPGIMRRVVIERAANLGIPIVEGPLPQEEIARAGEAFLTSSVRGMLPVARFLDVDLTVPGPVTTRLWIDIVSWLESGGLAR
jgi:branched-subunit amino acid aminotransferase/4-amino-4-deoxychorismate lyase